MAAYCVVELQRTSKELGMQKDTELKGLVWDKTAKQLLSKPYIQEFGRQNESCRRPQKNGACKRTGSQKVWFGRKTQKKIQGIQIVPGRPHLKKLFFQVSHWVRGVLTKLFWLSNAVFILGRIFLGNPKSHVFMTHPMFFRHWSSPH